ncbi:glycoside hydrolase family 16 protein [Candidatus Izimaplasma bacterium]|nr:glycoside hydrolase family 16 protein [Candidatus Izimaplasma bacterium]
MKLIKHYDFTKDIELNRDEWNVAVGEKWSNNELQHYVDKKENLFFENGLVIKATYDGKNIESSRIHTKNKFSFKYGKIEINLKVPKGKGTWPAAWMMPLNNLHGHWPRSGEIDIMEHCGNDLNKLFLCIHTKKYNHRDGDQYYRSLNVEDMTNKFFVYGLEWTENKVVYYLNNKEVGRYEKGENGKDTSWEGWPFDDEYYLILNLAMGGGFGGKVDMTSFPQEYIVKEIKVYQ